MPSVDMTSQTQTFEHVRIEIAEQIGTLTINRQTVRNAIDRATARELEAALTQLISSQDAGVVIVTGAGEQVFASGADLSEMRGWGREDGLAGITSSLYRSIEQCPKPTIAAINGRALGGGCELALACDLRVAAAHATFGLPEVGLGVIPAAGGTQRLPRLIGLGRARHLILTGDPIDAPTALSWGLVTMTAPAGDLMAAARQLAARLLARGPVALRLAKLALDASSRVDLDSGLLIERLAQAICFESREKVEGTAAFFEKRPPRFRK